MSTHKIINIDFTNTNPWYKSKKDITMTADLLLPEFKKASMKVELLYGEYVEQTEEVTESGETVLVPELDIIELLPETDYSEDTKRQFVIPFDVLHIGLNTVIVTFKDEDEPHEQSKYVEEIVLEDRNTFSVNRLFKNNSEYITTGEVKIDNTYNLHTSGIGMESGAAISKNCIEMDGRCSIQTININSDNDENKQVILKQDYNYIQDHYDYVVYKYPIGKYMQYESMQDITLTEEDE